MPGCLIAFITLILFPFLYLRYKMWQFTRQVNKNNPFNSQERDAETHQRNDRSYRKPTNSQHNNQGTKPHIIKPNEGEYVDFTEVND